MRRETSMGTTTSGGAYGDGTVFKLSDAGFVTTANARLAK